MPPSDGPGRAGPGGPAAAARKLGDRREPGAGPRRRGEPDLARRAGSQRRRAEAVPGLLGGVRGDRTVGLGPGPPHPVPSGRARRTAAPSLSQARALCDHWHSGHGGHVSPGGTTVSEGMR